MIASHDEPSPPSYLAAEQAVIGCLLSTDSPLDFGVGLTAACFADPVHGAIFQMVAECDAAGKPRNLFTIRAALVVGGALDQVGGARYLARMVSI